MHKCPSLSCKPQFAVLPFATDNRDSRASVLVDLAVVQLSSCKCPRPYTRMHLSERERETELPPPSPIYPSLPPSQAHPALTSAGSIKIRRQGRRLCREHHWCLVSVQQEVVGHEEAADLRQVAAICVDVPGQHLCSSVGAGGWQTATAYIDNS